MTGLMQLVANGAVQGLFIGMAALAITLVFGIARFPNAATGDVMTLGAYAGLTAQQMTSSLILAGAAAILAGAAAGLASYFLVFRRLAGRSVVASLVASIGVAFVIRAALGLIFGQAQAVFQVPLMRAQLYWGVRMTPLDLQISEVVITALMVIFAVLYFTPIGRQMRAVADDRDLARVSGIRPERVMVALWLMAGAVAGLAGMMLGIKTVVEPEVGWDLLLPAFTAAILGGIGSAPGAVLAGVLLGVAQEVSTPFVGFSYKIAVAFLVMLGVLLVRPSGLFGRRESVR
ncbi:MAG: branched-chain amino acid ABC transporter permease [Acetobacteraceae bacterium]